MCCGCVVLYFCVCVESGEVMMMCDDDGIEMNEMM